MVIDTGFTERRRHVPVPVAGRAGVRHHRRADQALQGGQPSTSGALRRSGSPAGEFKVLAQRFGVLEGMTGTGQARADVAAVVAVGEKNWHVSRDDLAGWDMGGAGAGEEQLNVKAEQALTGAIVQVTSGRATKVCVTRSTANGRWRKAASARCRA